MKKFLILALAGLAGGCATPGDIERLDATIAAVEEKNQAYDKEMNKLLVRIETLERDVKADGYRISKVDDAIRALKPPDAVTDAEAIWNQLKNSPDMDPKVRQAAADLVKELPVVATNVAFNDAMAIGKPAIPVLVSLLTQKEGPTRANARLVLQNWSPAELVPLLDHPLEDGTLRPEILKLLADIAPCPETRTLLLKHLNDGPDVWRVQVAEALTKAHGKEGITNLIALLYDENDSVRNQAYGALNAATGFDFGYKAWGPAEDRKTAALKWESWWKDNSGKFEFPKR